VEFEGGHNFYSEHNGFYSPTVSGKCDRQRNSIVSCSASNGTTEIEYAWSGSMGSEDVASVGVRWRFPTSHVIVEQSGR
jgi:hypothetical protein